MYKYPSTEVPKYPGEPGFKVCCMLVSTTEKYEHAHRACHSSGKYDTLLLDLSVKRDFPCVHVPQCGQHLTPHL